jgi:hypothetical protein
MRSSIRSEGREGPRLFHLSEDFARVPTARATWEPPVSLTAQLNAASCRVA